MKNPTSLSIAIAMTAALSIASHPAQSEDKPVGREKCFGIALKGQNDCSVKGGTSCAGSAVKDYQGDAWKFVPKGTCENLVSPTSPTGKGQLTKFQERNG
jgi:hypothetical protein